MFLQILPWRSLPMWMPEPQSGTREDWMCLRRCLQVRSCLHLQALVSNSNRAANCALGLVQQPDWGRYAASHRVTIPYSGRGGRSLSPPRITPIEIAGSRQAAGLQKMHVDTVEA